MSARNLTLSISAETAKKMDRLSEVNWSKIARDAIEKYIEDRLDTTLPPELLSRLRLEMGAEFVEGKKFALESLCPRLKYRKLSVFFETLNRNIENRESEISARYGVPEEEINVDEEAEAVGIINSKFVEIPPDSSVEFRKGVYSVLKELKKKEIK